MRHAIGLALVLLGLGCAGKSEPVVACDAVGNARPLCGYQNPEDLVLLPGSASLLVSEYGGMEGEHPGAISRLDLASEQRTVLYASGDGGELRAGWGDPACPGAPQQLSPHGIDLVRREDGALALLVVNHAGRESIEFFEVQGNGDALAWRGCVLAPEQGWWNEVVATREGGFYASQMLPKRGGVAQLLELFRAAVLHRASGYAVRWTPGQGFAQVAGTEVVFANGLALSPDGASLYVNSTLGDGLRRVSLASGAVEAQTDLPTLDNLAWGTDGQLYAASITAGVLEIQACNDLAGGACPAAFEIVRVDPATLAHEVVYRGNGAPMGAGTVGLRVGDELFIGSFAGDRVLRVALTQ
ncbi:MAG TPA: hypothetical protein VNF72_18010 [Myxococcota bacterium]|nr:hypothetical protein [Myxococcota bacterium]